MAIQQFDVGDTVKVSCTFRNAAGAVADPTTITGKFKEPGDTVATDTYVYGTDSELVKDSTGVYHMNIALDEAGPWWFRLAGTGAVAAAAEVMCKVRPSEF